MTEKKLSQEKINSIDQVVSQLITEWDKLKQLWQSEDDLQNLDSAFYRFIDVWLKADRVIDRETRAHSLEYWEDPDLDAVREAVKALQIRLSKIDDAERKRRGIENLRQVLQELEP